MNSQSERMQDLYRRWAEIEAAKRALAEDSRALFAEAKKQGFNVKALREVFRREYDQARGGAAREQHEADVDQYERLLADGTAVTTQARDAREASPAATASPDPADPAMKATEAPAGPSQQLAIDFDGNGPVRSADAAAPSAPGLHTELPERGDGNGARNRDRGLTSAEARVETDVHLTPNVEIDRSEGPPVSISVADPTTEGTAKQSGKTSRSESHSSGQNSPGIRAAPGAGAVVLPGDDEEDMPISLRR